MPLQTEIKIFLADKESLHSRMQYSGQVVWCIIGHMPRLVRPVEKIRPAWADSVTATAMWHWGVFAHLLSSVDVR